MDQGTPGDRRPVPTAAWWAAVVIALVAALLAGAGVFFWARASTSAKTAADDAIITEMRQQLQGMQTELARTRTELDSLKKAGATAPADPAAKPADTTSAAKQYTLIKKVYLKSGTWYVTADYIQFLTGKAAATAATAHGDESPPPNDYYILNDSKALRELPVAARATVKIVGGAGGDPQHPQNQTIWEFHDWFVSPNGDKSWVKDGVYVVTLVDGKVTAIDQQFLP